MCANELCKSCKWNLKARLDKKVLGEFCWMQIEWGCYTRPIDLEIYKNVDGCDPECEGYSKMEPRERKRKSKETPIEVSTKPIPKYDGNSYVALIDGKWKGFATYDEALAFAKSESMRSYDYPRRTRCDVYSISDEDLRFKKGYLYHECYYIKGDYKEPEYISAFSREYLHYDTMKKFYEEY